MLKDLGFCLLCNYLAVLDIPEIMCWLTTPLPPRDDYSFQEDHHYDK